MSCKMKIIEIENSKIAKLFGYSMTLYPFILYVGVPTETIRKHEMVHVKQIQTLGVLYFYVTYLNYYIKGRMSGLNHNDAYMAIPYEVEAYKITKP